MVPFSEGKTQTATGSAAVVSAATTGGCGTGERAVPAENRLDPRAKCPISPGPDLATADSADLILCSAISGARHRTMARMRGLFLGPRLLPNERWARLALALLVVFALARGLLWASTQPGWFAPDEDYHWLYTEHVLIEKTWPYLDEPFATQELFNTVGGIAQGVYYGGPRTDYRADPRASLRALERVGGSREATGEPPRQVLHPPGYHVGAVVVDRIVTNDPRSSA